MYIPIYKKLPDHSGSFFIIHISKNKNSCFNSQTILQIFPEEKLFTGQP